MLKDSKEKYGIRNISGEKLPKLKIPLDLMPQRFFSRRARHRRQNARGSGSAVTHPKRLIYRFSHNPRRSIDAQSVLLRQFS